MTSTTASAAASDSPDLRSLAALSDAYPAEYLDYYAVLPLVVTDGRLRVATWVDDVDPQALDDLRLAFQAEPELVRLPEQDVRAAIQRVYGCGSTAEALVADLDAGEAVIVGEEIPLDDLRSQANEAPVVRLVNLLILEAMEARASDVHLEGHARGLAVRYRVDGILQEAPTPPAHLGAAVVSRIKIMAELDIAERRVPQDGRIRLRLRDREVDVRVSVVPTLHGESVVLRILDRERGRVALEGLGMGSETLVRFVEAIGKPQGIVLATGPTGSGKTTTLYAALERLRTGREKILTVEDPIEYELTGVAQMPVNRKVGVTFATALRALLRQDPDILLVGEIRDGETAEIATHAALTGHLVLSTLHTNDATSAVTRLVDLGVADYLVASTVECVLAQRLVRCVCEVCALKVPIEEGWSAALGDPPAGLETVARGAGCDDCRGTGYRGRIGIFELLVFDDDLREALRDRPDARYLRRLAVEKGLRTLRDDGIRQIVHGVTTAEEVLRVTLG
ncbi:MAG: GspE/PulE family protein [Gemmatimonadota bacterium]